MDVRDLFELRITGSQMVWKLCGDCDQCARTEAVLRSFANTAVGVIRGVAFGAGYFRRAGDGTRWFHVGLPVCARIDEALAWELLQDWWDACEFDFNLSLVTCK